MSLGKAKNAREMIDLETKMQRMAEERYRARGMQIKGDCADDHEEESTEAQTILETRYTKAERKREANGQEPEPADAVKSIAVVSVRDLQLPTVVSSTTHPRKVECIQADPEISADAEGAVEEQEEQEELVEVNSAEIARCSDETRTEKSVHLEKARAKLEVAKSNFGQNNKRGP